MSSAAVMRWLLTPFRGIYNYFAHSLIPVVRGAADLYLAELLASIVIGMRQTLFPLFLLTYLRLSATSAGILIAIGATGATVLAVPAGFVVSAVGNWRACHLALLSMGLAIAAQTVAVAFSSPCVHPVSSATPSLPPHAFIDTPTPYPGVLSATPSYPHYLPPTPSPHAASTASRPAQALAPSFYPPFPPHPPSPSSPPPHHFPPPIPDDGYAVHPSQASPAPPLHPLVAPLSGPAAEAEDEAAAAAASAAGLMTGAEEGEGGGVAEAAAAAGAASQQPVASISECSPLLLALFTLGAFIVEGAQSLYGNARHGRLSTTIPRMHHGTAFGAVGGCMRLGQVIGPAIAAGAFSISPVLSFVLLALLMIAADLAVSVPSVIAKLRRKASRLWSIVMVRLSLARQQQYGGLEDDERGAVGVGRDGVVKSVSVQMQETPGAGDEAHSVGSGHAEDGEVAVDERKGGRVGSGGLRRGARGGGDRRGNQGFGGGRGGVGFDEPVEDDVELVTSSQFCSSFDRGGGAGYRGSCTDECDVDDPHPAIDGGLLSRSFGSPVTAGGEGTFMASDDGGTRTASKLSPVMCDDDAARTSPNGGLSTSAGALHPTASFPNRRSSVLAGKGIRSVNETVVVSATDVPRKAGLDPVNGSAPAAAAPATEVSSPRRPASAEPAMPTPAHTSEAVSVVPAVTSSALSAASPSPPVPSSVCSRLSSVAPIRVLRVYGLVMVVLCMYTVLVMYVRRSRVLIVTLITIEGLHLSPAAVGTIMSITGLVDTALFSLSGYLLDKSRSLAAVVMAVLMALGFAAIPFAFNAYLVVLITVVIGIGNACGSGIVLTLLADASPSDAKLRPHFVALFRVGSFGDVIAAVFTGLLYDTGGSVALRMGFTPAFGGALASSWASALVAASSAIFAVCVIVSPERLRRYACGAPPDYYEPVDALPARG